MLRAASLAALSLIAALVVACGGGSAGGETDPASAVPADAMFYGEANISPEGDVREDALAAAGKVLRTDDPEGKIRELLDKAFAEADTKALDYDKDIKPWLGDKAAVAITGFSAGEPEIAVVVNSTDDDKAREALARDKSYSEKRSFEGTDYRYDPSERSAAGVVDHFAIVASEPAFKDIVHLLDKGGQSLASSQDLQDARDKVGDQPGFLFVDLQAALRTFAGSAGATFGPNELSAINGLFKRFRAVGVGIGADAQAVRMTIASLGEGSSAGGEAASALPLEQAPGDAWLALTQGQIGTTIGNVLDALKDTPTGDQITQFETATGLKLKDDVLSWMGDAAVFLEGDSVPALGGALVIQSTDPAKTRSAIARIKSLLRQFNQPVGPAPRGTSEGFSIPTGAGKPAVLIGLAGSRFVIAYGQKALRDAIHPSSTLSSRPNFKSAQGLLGGSTKPSFYLDFQTLTRFIALVAGGDEDFAKAKPYLDAFTAVIGGGAGERKAEIAIGLK
jgi:hypothetical protein